MLIFKTKAAYLLKTMIIPKKNYIFIFRRL